MSTQAPVPVTGLVLAVAGAIAFSAKAIIVKLAYRHGVDAVTLMMWRMLLALPIFLVMAWWAGRGQPPLAPRDRWAVAGLGFCGYYLSSFLDFAGLNYISASLERLILYLNPTLVLLLGVLLRGHRVGRTRWQGAALSYLGVVLVFGHEVGVLGPEAVLGALLVFLSAVSYAVYLFFSADLVGRLGSLRLVGLATSVACGLCILQFLLLRPLQAAWVGSPVLLLSLLNATLCTALPVLLVMMAIERLGPSLATQIGMVGPFATIGMGALLLDEPITTWVGVGALLVIAGVYRVSRAPAVPAA